jgi:hypothetical protein
MSTSETKSKARGLAIKKWNDNMDILNKKYGTESYQYYGSNWRATLTLKLNLVYYEYEWTKGQHRGEVFARDHFPV